MSSLYLVLALCVFTAQAASPDQYRITSLPFYNDTLSQMYSGFIEVKEGDPSKQLFFWFFVNQENKNNTDFPVMLWLNGGPGSSSMDGLFMQNGPFSISQENQKPVITPVKHTWTKAAHMLYIDQPAGVGYSFVSHDDLLVRSDTQAAQQLHSVLINFFAIFSNYTKNPFYMSGQSYAGKYIPFTAQEILKNNQINLSGLIIGSGFMIGGLQRIMMSDLAEAIGMIQGNQIAQIDSLRVSCLEAFHSDPAVKLQKCNEILSYLEDMSLVDIENVLHLADNSQQPYQLYLNGTYSTDVLTALHVNNSTKTNKFSRRSPELAKAMQATKMINSLTQVDNLLSNNIPMLWYIGQFDGLDGVVGNEAVVKYLNWPRKSQFEVAPRWLYNTTAGNIAGYFKQVEGFTRLILSKAGHYAAGDQRTNTLAMVEDYIANQHKLPQNQGYNTPQKRMCEFMNYCNGNGQCSSDTGVCECNIGYYGEDCSYDVPNMQLQSTDQQHTLRLRPQAWIFMKHSDDISDFMHLVIEAKNAGLFTIYGLEEGDFEQGTLPDKQNYRFRVECMNYYVHYNKGDKKRFSATQGRDTQILGIYNPHSTQSLQLEISLITIYEGKVTENETSTWSPPGPLFWLEIVIVIGTLVSLGFNYYQYKVLKKVSHHSYSVANLNSSIAPSSRDLITKGTVKSDFVEVNRSKTLLSD